MPEQTPKCHLCGADLTAFDKEECRKFYSDTCVDSCTNCNHGIRWVCFRCVVDESGDDLEIDPDEDKSE